MNPLIDQNDIMGQRRTSSHKKFLVYKPETPYFVYKGPYNIDGTDQLYNNIYYREEILKEWNAKQIIFMKDIVEFDKLFYNDKKRKKIFALSYLNLRSSIPEDSIINIESWEPRYEYKISNDDNNCVKLSKTTNPEDYFTKELVRSLIYLYILETGDVGTYNIIVCNDSATIIDYEETRVKDSNYDDMFFFFSKRPSKFFRDKTEHLLIKYFEKLIYDIENLDLSVIDEDYISKTKAKTRHNNVLSIINSFIYVGSPRKPVQRLSKTRSIENVNIGDMMKKYKNTKTSQGHSDSIIKSALQKNIRRCDSKQALACAFELQRFQLINSYDVVHNMYNRLAIISCEDVTASDLGVQAYICGWNKLFVRNGTIDWLKKKTTLDLTDRYNDYRLAGIVQYLSELKKTRVSSHVWRCYTLESARQEIKRLGYYVEDLNLSGEHLEEDVLDFENQNVPYLKKSDFKIGDGSLALCSIIIHNRLRNNDFNAIGWIQFFRENFLNETPVVKVEKREGKTRCDIILWNIFSQFVSIEIIFPIKEMYYSIAENKTVDNRRALLSTVAVRILMRSEIEKSKVIANLSKISDIIDLRTKKCESDPSFNKYIKGRIEIKIEPYMIDKHTGKKGNDKDLRKQFVIEGAFVNKQDNNYLIPDMKEVYEM